MPRSVAVIGSGIAGLTAAYVLQRNADVTLYEALPWLGGHSHTHDVLDGPPSGSGPMLAVDSGFIVHNAQTYPTLLRLFAELAVLFEDKALGYHHGLKALPVLKAIFGLTEQLMAPYHFLAFSQAYATLDRGLQRSSLRIMRRMHRRIARRG